MFGCMPAPVVGVTVRPLRRRDVGAGAERPCGEAAAPRRPRAPGRPGYRGVMARVLLVDDHALVRAGVARLLADEDAFEVVGECGDAGEAVRLARRLEPDVVVLDIQLGA